MLNAFTVDLEDYFHTVAMSEVCPADSWAGIELRVERSSEELLGLLRGTETKATFFVLGWVADKAPNLIRQIVTEGHEIACHSYWHRPVYKLSRDEFREDTLRAKSCIEEASGKKVRGYRAPSFSIVDSCPWAFEVLEELGFEYDSSINPIRHDIASNAKAPRLPHRLESSGLVELPVTTLRFAGNNFPAGGGAYLRILPEALTHKAIRDMNLQESTPAMIYMHPWEIDAEQPRLPVRLKSRIRQYTGLKGMAGKVSRLLKTFEFAPIEKAFHEILATASQMQHKPAEMSAAGN